MNEVSTILLIIMLGLTIWLIITFVNMAKDVEKIKFMVSDTHHGQESKSIGMREVNLALLLGNREETYKRIITVVYNNYIKNCYEDQQILFPSTVYKPEEMQRIVEKAERYCAKLGYALPEELQSMEEFLEFYNS